MSLKITNLSANSDKRYDVDFLLEGGLFEKDRAFKFRLLKNFEGELTEGEIIQYAQTMLKNQKLWGQGKVWYTFNGFEKRESAYILKSSWHASTQN